MCRRRRSYLLVSLLLLCLPLLVRSEKSVYEVYEKIVLNERLIERFELLAPKALLENYRSKRDELVQSNCARDLDLYTQAIDRQELWALKMLDASSGKPSGILQGNVVDFGVYDECVKVKGHSIGIKISGRHCMYEIRLPCEDCMVPLVPTLSICLPRTCEANDLLRLVKATSNASNISRGLTAHPIVTTCLDPNDDIWDWKFIGILAGERESESLPRSVAGIYIGFLVACTICDIVQRQRKHHESSDQQQQQQQQHQQYSEVFETLVRFSILKNSRAILNTKAHEGNLAVVNGIRFISSLLIIFFHAHFFQTVAPISNFFYLSEWWLSWKSIPAILAHFAVDTFFTISGFLMAYKFFEKVRKGTYNAFRFFIHRYMRLTIPAFIIFILTEIVILRFGSGPRWQWMQDVFCNCNSKWWSFLLHVQNIVETNNYCMLHYWTIGVDMQLFTISLFILHLIYKKREIGLMVLRSLILLSMISTAFIVGKHGYYTTVVAYGTNLQLSLDAMNDVYLMTYTRAVPFFFGLLLGYEIQNQYNKSSKFVTGIGWYVGWSCVAVIFLTFIIVTMSLLDVNYNYVAPLEIVFSTTSRPAWSLMICWIIYSSINNAGGPVAKFFAWKYFLPLSRLCFSLYIVHLSLPLFRTMTIREPAYFSSWSIAHHFVGDVGVSLVLALWFSVAVELPTFVIDDLIFGQKKSILNKTLKQNTKDVNSNNVTNIGSRKDQ